MKNLFALSALAATSLASIGLYHNHPESKTPKVLDMDYVPLNPDRRCMEFYTAFDDEGCWEQWDEWEWYCDSIDWDDQCEAVMDHFYDQDIDWKEPDTVGPECIAHWSTDAMTDECWESWTRTWNQCMMEEDYWRQPYMWTTMCDAAEQLVDAIETFDEAIGLVSVEPARVLAHKRAVFMKRFHPETRKDLNLMIKRVAPVEQPCSGSNVSAAAMGFSAGFVGIIAIAALAKNCKSKSKFDQDFLYERQ